MMLPYLVWATLLLLVVVSPSSAFTAVPRVPAVSTAASRNVASHHKEHQIMATRLFQSSSSLDTMVGTPTELPDSLEDGAQMAAQACAQLIEAQGMGGRCRIDFDTSAGDETYTLLKSSTEFMQNLVRSLTFLQIPELQQVRQDEMMRVVQAKTELDALQKELDALLLEAKDDKDDNLLQTQKQEIEAKIEALMAVIQRNGADPNYEYKGPMVRVYMPDEGNAALARRDWPGVANFPRHAVRFSSCGGVQRDDISKDKLIFFFCPRASESEYVEQILVDSEQKAADTLQLTVLVNPLLVDMGVTGFGMAGRLLRERLIDPLVPAYYLRTLQWGALTRVWPRDFSVWQEDEDAEGGYRLIKALPSLPSNPEVEDIYDIENGNMAERKSGGFLDQFGDFVNGMMRL